MQVMLTFQPGPDDWPLIERSWPAEVTPVMRRPSPAVDGGAEAPGPVTLVDDVDDVEALVGHMRGAQLELVRRATRLRLIHTLGHGVDALLSAESRELLRGRDIVVARANPASITIAEFTIMNMIALSRRVISVHTALVQRGDWSTDLKAQRSTGVLGGELHGKVLGLVGYGNIGREIHVRARAFGMTVGALVRSRHAGTDLHFQCQDVADFLGRCDYVVLCAPLTPATRHLIDAGRIALMKDGAYLLNISRGPLIDEGALHDALRSGKLAGAALDVWDVEEQGGPLTGYPSAHLFHNLNVVMTPHYSGATRESRERAFTAVGRNLRRLLDGEPLHDVVDLDRGF
jgi:phosphoglycerate dehydrogenase-like enzyme